MKIGNLEIKGCAALAPMAGVADRAMREICMGYGASFCVGELASAKGISLSDKKSAELLSVSPCERPMASQLFGCDEKAMADAALKALEYKPDFIDINMGCPAPKVAMNGGGSGLLKDLPLAEKIAASVIKAVDGRVPVTAKIRLGWDAEHYIACELAKRLEACGIAMVTVHGRTREQKYAPPVDIKAIAEVKKAVKIPVVANGDIFTAKDAARMYEQTGCDMVMVGRGAQGSPWIFQQIEGYILQGSIVPDPPVSERMRVLLHQAELMCRYKDPYIAMLQVRKHAAWYMKGLKSAAEMRSRVFSVSSIEELSRLCCEIINKQLPAD